MAIDFSSVFHSVLFIPLWEVFRVIWILLVFRSVWVFGFGTWFAKSWIVECWFFFVWFINMFGVVFDFWFLGFRNITLKGLDNEMLNFLICLMVWICFWYYNVDFLIWIFRFLDIFGVFLDFFWLEIWFE